MYTIEELFLTFKMHHKKAIQFNDQLLKEFQENNPGEPIPEWYKKDEFSLPMALSSMCKELLELRRYRKRNEEENCQ